MLIPGDVDLICSSLSLNPERFHVLDYLLPVTENRVALIVARSQKYTEMAIFVFLRPFSKHVWLALGLQVIGIVTLIKIIAWILQTNGNI